MELSLDEGKFLDSKSLSAPLSRHRRCCARLRGTGHRSAMETGQSALFPGCRLPPSHFLPEEDFCSVFQGTRSPRRKQKQRSRRTCLPPSLCCPENQPLGSQAVGLSRGPHTPRNKARGQVLSGGREPLGHSCVGIARSGTSGREPRPGSRRAVPKPRSPAPRTQVQGAWLPAGLVARPPPENSHRRSVTRVTAPASRAALAGFRPRSPRVCPALFSPGSTQGAAASPRKAGPLDTWPAEGLSAGASCAVQALPLILWNVGPCLLHQHQVQPPPEWRGLD